MPNFNAPGVYIQDVVSGKQTVDQLSSSVGVMLGETLSGVCNTLQKIKSWTEFIEKYAFGLDSPFDANMYLPYSVYGFFQNGGKELYVGRVAVSAQKSTGTASTSKITATALYEGVWANGITVEFTKNSAWSNSNLVYDVKVTFNGETYTVTGVTFSNVVGLLNADANISKFLVFSSGDGSTLTEETITLSGGSAGSTPTDADYISALNMIDSVSDVTMVAIPGQTSSAVNTGILSYCDAHELFPIIDMPVGTTVEGAQTHRKSLNAFTGVLTYPWGKVTDPITNSLKSVPTAGHVMGVYARTIESRGVFKSPAGVDAQVRGFVELVTVLTSSDLNLLNPIGVVCIVSRPNAGIVIWGARSLNSTDSTMKYITDGLLNLNIKKSLYQGTQFAVFEPNDEGLWSRLNTACTAFLESLRQQGALKGEYYEAYYVTIDGSNNTPATIAEGQLNIEIGYAPVKPAEFVIIKLAHSIVGA